MQSNTAAWTCNIKISTDDMFPPSLPLNVQQIFKLKWLEVFFGLGRVQSSLVWNLLVKILVSRPRAALDEGDCYMVLRDARLRTTFSPEDSNAATLEL